MKHDMITVFNQLTSSELADCNLFRNLLSNHFLKFRYFYSLTENINLNHIDKIICEDKKSFITICIVPKNTEYLNGIAFNINKNKRNSSLSDKFDIHIGESESKIFIDIELNEASEEGDIYYAD